MAHPQPGIFAMGNPAHIFFESSLTPGVRRRNAITTLLGTDQLFDAVSGTNTVIGLRPTLWNSLSPNNKVPQISDFADAIVGVDGFTIPATQRDI